MKKIIIGALASILSGSITVSLQPPLFAKQNRIPASVAQGKTESSPTLEVSPFGITLSFEDLKESIDRYWAADNSYLRVGTNAPLGPEANILFLKTVGQPTAKNVGTTLTVQTKDASGFAKTYSFLVKFTRTQPKSTIVRIYPDDKPVSSVPKSSSTPTKPLSPSPAEVPEPPNTPRPNLSTRPSSIVSAAPTPPQQPLLPVQKSQSQMKPYSVVTQPRQQPIATKPRAVALKPKTTASQLKVPSKTVRAKAPAPSARPIRNVASILSAHAQANALIRGLSVANKTGEVGRSSVVTRKVQSVVLRLRRGESMRTAIQRESVEQKTIDRLLQLGNYQPTS